MNPVTLTCVGHDLPGQHLCTMLCTERGTCGCNSHEYGIAVAEKWCAETGVPMYELRRLAADHLANDDWPEGEGIGTSDVSIHLSALARFEPEVLFDKARPLVLIAKSAALSGKSYEETKDGFRKLFAPA